MMLNDQPSSKRLNPSVASGAWRSPLILARWRWRQHWFMLFMAGLGIVGAITIVSALPLFANVTTTTGLRSILDTPATSDISLRINTLGLSSTARKDIEAATSNLLGQHL